MTNAAQISKEKNVGPIVSLESEGRRHVLTFHSGKSKVTIVAPFASISVMSFEESEIKKTVFGAKATVITAWEPGIGGWDGILLNPSFASITVEQVNPDKKCAFYRNGNKITKAKRHTYVAGAPTPSGKIKNIAPAGLQE